MPTPPGRGLLVPLHGIASRHDLPLPFSYVLIGAAAALAVSFVVLLVAWRTPRLTPLRGLPLPGLQRLVDRPATRVVVRVLGCALVGWVLLGLLFGQDRLTNPVFGFVFVWTWVGLVPLSLLAGPVWRLANPLRTVHRVLCAVARIDPQQGLATLPGRVGVWPAALGLFGFAWLELVQPDRTTLAVLRVWVLVFGAIMIIGAIVFGQRWMGAADPFETYATSVAQLSPWGRVGGRLRLVNPLAGLTAWDPPPGTVAVLSVLLGSTAFDSFANTSWWIQTVQSSAVPPSAWDTAGLLALIVIVAATFTAAATWMARYLTASGVAGSGRDLPRLMAPSVVPIVIGYAVAHYATLFVVEGQRTLVNLSDPLGRGWNVLGTAQLPVDETIFAHPTAIAVTQLVAILAGHVLGIVAAHELSVRLLPASAALRGQWPMLLVMVFFTCSGLVLLFSP